MQNRFAKRGGLSFLVGLWALAFSAGLDLSAGAAQEAVTGAPTAAPSVSAEPQKPARKVQSSRRKATAAKEAPGQYFVEFRARSAASYGHTFLAHGRLNTKGEIIQMEVAGLHPATESPVPWMIGHVVPVRSETGPSDGDLDEQYVTARYRVVLDDAEYAKVSAFIRNLQANSPLWHAVLYNCNAFVGDVVHFMGLKIPHSSLLFPADYINAIRDLNSGQPREAAAAYTSSVQ